jgi:hypothetical protein
VEASGPRRSNVSRTNDRPAEQSSPPSSRVVARDFKKTGSARSKNALFDMMAHINGHPELSKNAVLVGVMLADGAWWDPGRGVFAVTVKHKTLGIRARIKSPTTIRKALAELAAAGIVRASGNWRKNDAGLNRRAANSYDIQPREKVPVPSRRDHTEAPYRHDVTSSSLLAFLLTEERKPGQLH